MKVKVLVDEERPKVDPDDITKRLRESGLKVGARKADVGIVVGGDGIFSYYGRSESEPLLFVGVRTQRVTGSKAYMAQTYYDELEEALAQLKRGGYSVRDCERLEVFKNDRSLGEVFTDVYLQRGEESNSLRYSVRVTGSSLSIQEAAIGDGVVVTTAYGATGYYSYPDRVKDGLLDVNSVSRLEEGKIGICHIVPTFIQREGDSERRLRYTIPDDSIVELRTTRRSDARLYGAESGRGGTKVGLKDRIRIQKGEGVTRLVILQDNQT